MVDYIKFENKCLNKNCNNILNLDDSRAFCLNCNLVYIVSDRNNVLEIDLNDNINNTQINLIYFVYIREYGLYIKPSIQNINLIDKVICELNIAKSIDIQDAINNLYSLNKLTKKIIDLELFQ